MNDIIMSAAEKSVDLLMNLIPFREPAARPKPRIIAHRGAWDQVGINENSLEAFRRAQQIGIAGIEFDVRFTQDGVAVINHDADLLRFFNSTSKLSALSYAELKQLAPKIPTLQQVLALSDLHFMIEIKEPLTPKQTQALSVELQSLTPARDYHLLALDPALVIEHAKLPFKAWILVGELKLSHFTRFAIERGLAGVAGHYLGMTAQVLTDLHAAGLKAGVGFTPTRNLYRREWARGVDWVFTNRPSALI